MTVHEQEIEYATMRQIYCEHKTKVGTDGKKGSEGCNEVSVLF